MAATGAWKLYEGVKKQKDGFRAQITIEGKLQNLGTFDTPKEAAQAYDRAAIQAGRSTSDLNFLTKFPRTTNQRCDLSCLVKQGLNQEKKRDLKI